LAKKIKPRKLKGVGRWAMKWLPIENSFHEEDGFGHQLFASRNIPKGYLRSTNLVVQGSIRDTLNYFLLLFAKLMGLRLNFLKISLHLPPLK
jgi:hypothetical protein